MKKLMFTLCMAVVAFAANASYVDWAYTFVDPKTGGTGIDYTSGYTAYLITESAYTGLGSSWTQSDLATAATDSSAFYSVSAGKSNKGYETGSAGSAGVRQATGSTGNYHIILASATGYQTVVSGASVIAYDDPTALGNGNTPNITITDVSATAPQASSMTFTAYPTGGGSGGGVPEPTSGLLLALGGAMLALRRKRA